MVASSNFLHDQSWDVEITGATHSLTVAVMKPSDSTEEFPIASDENKNGRISALRLALWTWDLMCEHWFILGVGFAIG